MDINIRSILAFKNISESAVNDIKQNAEILSYRMGFPICKKDFIPNKVLFIISGEARFIHSENNISSSIAKLVSDDLIGLSSILCAKGCESVKASTDLVALALSDELILKLYVK